MNEQILNIVNIAKKDNGMVDDHTGEFEKFSYSRITGIGCIDLYHGIVCADDSWHPFAMFDTSMGYSINDLYVGNDGHVHISRRSISGPLFPARDDNHGFDAYNAEIRENHEHGLMQNTKEKEFKVLYSIL